MDPGQTIVIVLGAFLALWFAFASAYNRRLGVRTYRWIQAGAKTFGGISEGRWFGSSGSGGRLTVAKAARPFRRVEIAFLLETRELLPLWLLNRLRGRRDYMIVKADLRSAPRGDVEILPGDSRRFGAMGSTSGGEAWSMVESSLPAGFAAARRGRETDAWIESVSPLLASDGGSIRRLSVARTSPHVIAEINLPLLMTAPAPEFFARLSQACGAPGEQAQTD